MNEEELGKILNELRSKYVDSWETTKNQVYERLKRAQEILFKDENITLEDYHELNRLINDLKILFKAEKHIFWIYGSAGGTDETVLEILNRPKFRELLKSASRVDSLEKAFGLKEMLKEVIKMPHTKLTTTTSYLSLVNPNIFIPITSGVFDSLQDKLKINIESLSVDEYYNLIETIYRVTNNQLSMIEFVYYLCKYMPKYYLEITKPPGNIYYENHVGHFLWSPADQKYLDSRLGRIGLLKVGDIIIHDVDGELVGFSEVQESLREFSQDELIELFKKDKIWNEKYKKFAEDWFKKSQNGKFYLVPLKKFRKFEQVYRYKQIEGLPDPSRLQGVYLVNISSEIARKLGIIDMPENISQNSIKRQIQEFSKEVPEYFDIVKLILAHLIAGKNVILYGPPGTSKTYLAKKICEIICGKNNFGFHTANAEWSHFDVVGGHILKGNVTEYKPGILLEAIQEDKQRKGLHWLIIDELNRANLDLAFGKIFTQLDIDYRERTPIEKVGEEEYFIPLSFRILATMNTYDRALLFSLGYAFARRFAFVPTESMLKEKKKFDREVEKNIPKEIGDSIRSSLENEQIRKLKEIIKQVVFNHFSKKNGNDKAYLYDEMEIKSISEVNKILSSLKIGEFDVIDVLLYLASEITNKGLVEIGQAILFDAAKFMVAYSRMFPEDDPLYVLDQSIVSYILPQLEYFMSRLRKSKLFEESEHKESWDKIKGVINGLNLSITLQKFDEAEKEFKVI
ncbi:MAG: AAA family ATPase [Nitrososphaeria archaeon]